MAGELTFLVDPPSFSRRRTSCFIQRVVVRTIPSTCWWSCHRVWSSWRCWRDCGGGGRSRRGRSCRCWCGHAVSILVVARTWMGCCRTVIACRWVRKWAWPGWMRFGLILRWHLLMNSRLEYNPLRVESLTGLLPCLHATRWARTALPWSSSPLPKSDRRPCPRLSFACRFNDGSSL